MSGLSADAATSGLHDSTPERSSSTRIEIVSNYLVFVVVLSVLYCILTPYIVCTFFGRWS